MGKLQQPKPPLSRRKPRKSTEPKKVNIKKKDNDKNTDESDTTSNESLKPLSPKSKCFKLKSSVNPNLSSNQDGQASAFDYDSDESAAQESMEQKQSKTKMTSNNKERPSSRYKKAQQAMRDVNADTRTKKRKVPKSCRTSNSSDEDDFDKPVKKPCLSLPQHETDILTTLRKGKGKRTTLQLKKNKTTQNVNIDTASLQKEETSITTGKDIDNVNKNYDGSDLVKNKGAKEKADGSDHPAIYQNKTSYSVDDKKTESSRDTENEKPLRHEKTDPENVNECIDVHIELESNQIGVKNIKDGIVCPVCKKVFDASEDLAKINEHANSCIDSQSEDEHDTKQPEITAQESSENLENAGIAGDELICNPQSSLSILKDHLFAFEYQNRKNSHPDLEDEGLFFCQICEKDLSRMNSQRRTQHINKCCDKVESVKENNTATSDGSGNSNVLSCPFCVMEMKSKKAWTMHLKKCAQKNNVPTSQLLEIKKQQDQIESSSKLEGTSATRTTNKNTKTTQAKKRKNTRQNLRGIDEETQLAMAMSASMAPPTTLPDDDGLVKKQKRQRKKGNEVIPALLLRSKEETKSVIAARAAEVVCSKDTDSDDDCISCTPVLAPSSLAQQFTQVEQANQQLYGKEELLPKTIQPREISDSSHNASNTSEVQSTSKQECSLDSKKTIVTETSIISLSDMIDNSDMCKSFLSFLHVDDSEVNTDTKKDSSEIMGSLWSMASLNNKENWTPQKFYVPGLLPAQSPKRPRKTPKKLSSSSSRNKRLLYQENGNDENMVKTKLVNEHEIVPTDKIECNEQRIEENQNCTKQRNASSLIVHKDVQGSTESLDTKQQIEGDATTSSSQRKKKDGENSTMMNESHTRDATIRAESWTQYSKETMKSLNSTSMLSHSVTITESQAVNVDILMELAGDDDDDDEMTQQERKPSDHDDDVFPSSGFYVPIKHSQDEEDNKSPSSSVNKLLSDLSNMIGNSLLSDVTIVTKGKQPIPGHSFMLVSRCKVFADMIQGARSTTHPESHSYRPVLLPFHDVEEEVMRCVLKYIYTASLSIPQNLLLPVKQLAQRLKLDEFEKSCLTSTELSETFPTHNEDTNGSCQSISAEDLFDAIFDKETGDEKIENENGRENSQEDSDGGFDDDDIEEVRIFQTQANQKMRTMSEETRGQEALRSMLGLVDDVARDCDKRDIPTIRDSSKMEGDKDSVNTLRDNLMIDADNEKRESNEDHVILLGDEKNTELLRDHEKSDKMTSSDVKSARETGSTNVDVTGGTSMCETKSNIDELHETSDAVIYDELLHNDGLCDINDQEMNNPEFSDNEQRDTSRDVCDIDNKMDGQESHEIEDVDMQPEQSNSADAVELETDNHFKTLVIDKVDLTFEGEAKDNDGASFGGNYADGCGDITDGGGNINDGDDGDDQDDVIIKPTYQPTELSMYKDIETESDEYDGNVAILSQSISLLSDDDNDDDDDVMTSPQDQVHRNVVPETPHPKSNRIHSIELADLSKHNSPSKPSSKTTSGSNSHSSDQDSDSDGNNDEGGDAFLEKLRANIKSNNEKKQKKQKKMNARKSRSTLQKRKFDDVSNEKSKGKQHTSKDKNSKSKEGVDEQESCIGNKRYTSSNARKGEMTRNTLELMDVDEASDDCGGNSSRNRSRRNDLEDMEKGLVDDNIQDDLPSCATRAKLRTITASPLKENDKFGDGCKDDELLFQYQTEDLMYENPSTDIILSDNERNDLPSPLSTVRVISPPIPSPPYAVSPPHNDILSPPHTMYSPSKSTPSPPRSGLPTTTSFQSPTPADFDYTIPSSPLPVTNIDESDVEDQSPVYQHVTMPTTPLTSLVSSPFKSNSSKSPAKEQEDEDRKEEPSSEGEPILVDGESESEKSGFASATSKSKVLVPGPSGTQKNETNSKGVSTINTKKSLFRRLNANTYGLDKDEVAVSSDEESESSTPLSSQHKDASDVAMNNQVHDFDDDGGFNCDVDEFADYLEGDDSFMVNAADELESQELNDGNPSGVACTPINKPKPGCSNAVVGYENASTNNPSPITPIPDFQNMETPDLKCEVSKFGVRPLPKKKMVAKLKEIHVYLRKAKHGVSSSQNDIQNSKPPPKTSARAASQIQDNSDSDESSGPSRPSRVPAKTTRGRGSKKNVQKKQDGPKEKPVDIHLQQTCLVEDLDRVGSSDGDDRSTGVGTADSENEEEEFGEVSVLIDSETATQQVQSENLNERLRMFITSNKDIYLKVLHYQPIDFISLHEMIKSYGIKCSASKLVDFLDEQCITFTTAGSKPRQKRRKPPKKK